MKRSALVIILAACISLTVCPVFAADDSPVLSGMISDVAGKGVEGASVFVYTGPDIRRPADFISGRTGRDGRFRLVLPPGKYWVVARLKKTEGYGPLMPGDKHSGEPRVLEVVPHPNIEADFTVADIREAALIRYKTRDDFIRIKGRVLDEQGLPVKAGYVIANKSEKKTDMPDYLSGWTDDEGHYMIYLPRGKYYLGAASVFPPGKGVLVDRAVFFDADMPGLDITLRPEAGALSN